MAKLKITMFYTYSYSSETNTKTANIQDDGSLLLRLELPGVKKEELNISYAANKVDVTYTNDLKYTYTEKFSVGPRWDVEATDATLENGVLKLAVPKNKPTTKNTIQVK